MDPFDEVLSALAPIAAVLVGFGVGLAVRSLLIGRLLELASRSATELDDAILRGLRGPVVLWFTLVGLHAATLVTELQPGTTQLIQRTVIAAVIASITWIGAKLAGLWAQRRLMHATGLLPSASLVRNTVRGFVLVVGGLVLLQTLGIAVTPIITALGVGGLAVALALQDTLANFFAGLRLLAAGKVRPGDFIELDSGQRGFVQDVTWNQTTIRQLPNLLTVVPNSKMATAIVTNCSLPDPESAVLVQVGVSYASDLAHVERVTVDVGREVMREVEGGVPEFEPFIRYNQFGDSSVNFTVILRGKEFTSRFLVTHEFIKRLHARYEREAIEIPFPQRTLRLGPEALSLRPWGSPRAAT
jgi:small-conductance mechanosensitive channel